MPPKGKKAVAGWPATVSPSTGPIGGMVFKGRWKLGRLLGEGACATVYEVTDVTGAQSDVPWVIKVAALGSGKVVSKGKKKVDPQKKNADTLYWEHMIYKTYLRGLAGIPLLPEQMAFGDDEGFRFLVMQRLGRNLMEEFEATGKSWPPSVVASFGKQALTTLESLHDRQLIFVDVKPENFMLGLPGTANSDRVYLVDFGLVARYTAFDGGHKVQVKEGMGGTPLYVSLACHQGSNPSRRDDIEGLGYVLTMFLRGGNLPWEDVTSDAECLAKKKATTLEALCQGIPGSPIILSFLRQARDTAFDAKPDYQAFHALLDRLAAEGAASSSKSSRGRRGKATAAAAAPSSPAESKATKSSSNKKKNTNVASDVVDETKPAAAPIGSGRGRTGRTKGSNRDEMVVVPDGEEEPEENSKAKPPTKRVRQSKGASGGAAKRHELDQDGEAEEESVSSWISFMTEPVRFLMKSLSGVKAEEAGKGRRVSKSRKSSGKEESDDSADEDDLIDLTSAKITLGSAESCEDGDDDDVMIVEAPSKTRSSARVGAAASSSHSSSTAMRQRKTKPPPAPSSSSVSSALAFQVTDGPHAGERFIIEGSGAVYGGRGATGGVSLPKDRNVEVKHCSIKPGQGRSQSLRIAPVAGSNNVILVNGAKVGKTGRELFIGDVVQIGDSRMILQK